MSLDHKPFSSLVGEDILALRDNDVRENARLEYKSALPGQQAESKKEFLADVSSFANSRGGYVLFGVQEVEGAPVAFPGVDAEKIDTEILRLESIVRDGLEPRLPSIEFRPIPLEDGTVLIAGAIPSSTRAPHMVKYGGSSRFYGRHSTGKYQMDVGEIRSAFLRSELLAERARSFRRERLELWGDTGPIAPPPTVIVQLIPESFVDTNSDLDLSTINEERLRSWASSWLVPGRIGQNIDGTIVFNKQERNAVIQLLRNGIVEAVGEHIFIKFKRESDTESKQDTWVWMNDLETLLVGTIKESFGLQRELGVSGPVWVALSMIGAHGVHVAGGSKDESGWLDRRRLLFQEVLIETNESLSDEQLLPITMRLWQAAGLDRPTPDLERAG